ncbi:hypothetical protein [Nonomuraea dietziae]|uniref:hypothetical protein n=1 Tax=Nonomuraea dietziae TaxID=65515 RepID=UPI0031DE1D43
MEWIDIWASTVSYSSASRVTVRPLPAAASQTDAALSRASCSDRRRPQRGQLDREVGPLGQTFQHREAGAHLVVGLGPVGDLLAQVVDRDEQAPVGQVAHHGVDVVGHVASDHLSGQRRGGHEALGALTSRGGKKDVTQHISSLDLRSSSITDPAPMRPRHGVNPAVPGSVLGICAEQPCWPDA